MPAMTETDEALYESFIKEGREDALRTLLERHREGLTLFIYAIVGDMDDAEDLMLDAFAAAAAGTSRFLGRSSFKTWLFSIGRNLAAGHMRKRKGPHLPLDDELAGFSAVPELEILKNEETRQLQQALSSLKPEYRQALTLIYFEDMSYEEAGTVMKQNRRQMYHLIERGKTSHRETLERMGADFARY